jgi:hypothetical protein
MGRVSVSASPRAEAVTRATVRIGAALVLSVLVQTAANAGNASTDGCGGRWTGFNCTEQATDSNIRIVPEPVGENQKSLFAARDRRWVDHCHPTVQYDRYGVARYRYAATGCEFGVGAE